MFIFLFGAISKSFCPTQNISSGEFWKILSHPKLFVGGILKDFTPPKTFRGGDFERFYPTQNFSSGGFWKILSHPKLFVRGILKEFQFCIDGGIWDTLTDWVFWGVPLFWGFWKHPKGGENFFIFRPFLNSMGLLKSLFWVLRHHLK
jgi:hypothetical protein